MKTKLLLLLFFFGSIYAFSQVTHDLDWTFGANGGVANITINQGDTVRWTWRDTSTHTVTNMSSSAEIFDSGSITGNGMTYSYTFNVVGTNPYQCDFHPTSMNGIITVQSTAGIEEFKQQGFSVLPNPVSQNLSLNFETFLDKTTIQIYNILGKQVYNRTLSSVKKSSSIDVSQFAKGVYLVRVISDKVAHTRRFIKN